MHVSYKPASVLHINALKPDPWLLAEGEVDIDEFDHEAPVEQEEAILREKPTEKVSEAKDSLSEEGYSRLKSLAFALTSMLLGTLLAAAP